VAARSCGQKAVVTCRGGNLRTPWWTPAVKEAVRLKEAFRAWLAQGSPETAHGYREARRAAAAALGWGRPWRTTFGWPQGSFGKPFGNSGRESRAWLRLFSVGEENCSSRLGILSGGGKNILRNS